MTTGASGYDRAAMKPSFPPPDPNEQVWPVLADGVQIPAPTAIFPMGDASPEADRIADGVLDVRPGLFVVVAGG